MSHGTEQHLEHAEHAQHAAHNPFDKKVAMSMATIAAVLAAVSTLSHRSHNQTLQLQGEAIRLQSEAATLHTQASDKWNWFQTKKQRAYLYGSQADLAVALGGSRPAARAPLRDLERLEEVAVAADKKEPAKGSAKPDGVAKKAQDAKEAKKAKKSQPAPTDPILLAAWWRGLVRDYLAEAKGLEAQANELVDKAHKKEEAAEKKLHESHHVHAVADRLDFGHLGLELALVLCSIAVLTKQTGFWYSGVAIAAVGACVSFTAYLL